MRLIFMGTPEFAVPSLKSLYHSGYEIVAVYCQPARQKGRGQQLQKSAVQKTAESLGLPVYTPITLKNVEVQQQFAGHNADVVIVAAYGLILPQAILNITPYGCINVHGSILPRWRGASPIQRSILAGDAVTGVTLMQMDVGLDSGPVLDQSVEVLITSLTTAVELENSLSILGADLVIKNLAKLAKLQGGMLPSTAQPNLGICYAPKLIKEDGLLDFSKSARDLDYQVRALNPWPGTWFCHNSEIIKVLKAAPLDDNFAVAPGTFYGTREFPLVLKCADHGLAIQMLQRPGCRALDSADFLRGYKKIVPVIAPLI